MIELLKVKRKKMFDIKEDDHLRKFDIMMYGNCLLRDFVLTSYTATTAVFSRPGCSISFNLPDVGDVDLEFTIPLGTSRRSLWVWKIVDAPEFNTKDIQVGRDYKIEINGKTIIGCVDSVQHNAINIVFFDYRVHASTGEKNYVLKRLVIRFPEYDEETGKIKLKYTTLYESDMHPAVKETSIFADDITIEEI